MYISFVCYFLTDEGHEALNVSSGFFYCGDGSCIGIDRGQEETQDCHWDSLCCFCGRDVCVSSLYHGTFPTYSYIYFVKIF